MISSSKFFTIRSPERVVASHQLKEHCSFLALEPPAVEVAPLQLLATLAAEATAIPAAVTQRIASGTDIWITHVSDVISLAQIEGGTSINGLLFANASRPEQLMFLYAARPQRIYFVETTCWRFKTGFPIPMNLRSNCGR